MFQMEPAKWGGLCLPKVHQEEVVLVFTTGVSLSSAKVPQLHSPHQANAEKWNDLLVLPMAGSTKTYKSDLLNMSRLVICCTPRWLSGSSKSLVVPPTDQIRTQSCLDWNWTIGNAENGVCAEKSKYRKARLYSHSARLRANTVHGIYVAANVQSQLMYALAS